MLKYITIFSLLIMLMATPAEAQDNIGGNIGMEYNTLRSEINWYVGLNYTIEDKLTIGFDLHNWTTPPNKSNMPPFIGFASMSTYFLWHVSLQINEYINIKVERFYENWMKQSDNYDDYVGIKYSIEHSF